MPQELPRYVVLNDFVGYTRAVNDNWTVLDTYAMCVSHTYPATRRSVAETLKAALQSGHKKWHEVLWFPFGEGTEKVACQYTREEVLDLARAAVNA